MNYFGILKKVSFVSAGNILNAGFGLIFLTASARVLSPTDFGRYALLTTLLVFMSKVVDFGSNSVFVAESLKELPTVDGGTVKSKDKLVRTFVALKIVLFSLAMLFSLIAFFILGFRSPVLLAIFLGGLFFYSINVTLFAFFQSAEMFGYAVLLNTIPAFLKAIIGGFMLLGIFSLSFTAICATFCLSMGLCVVLYYYVPKEFRQLTNSNVIKSSFIQVFKASLPAGVSQLISQGWPAISNTIIKFYKSLSDIGIFYLADKIANVFSLISLSIFTVILPQNARRRKENLPHDLRETGVLALLVMILAVGFVSVSGVFVKSVFGDKYAGSMLILDILVISAAISAIHAFMENYFYVHDSTRTIMHISLAKLSVFVILSFLLLPILSLKGLALSQLTSSVIGLVLVSFLTVRDKLKV